jgi:hypothetical protein
LARCFTGLDPKKNYATVGEFSQAFQTAKTNPTFRWVGPQLLDGYVKAGKTTEAKEEVTVLVIQSQ